MHVEKADNLSSLSGNPLPERQQYDAVAVYGEVREHIMRKPAPNRLLEMHKKSNEGRVKDPKRSLKLLSHSSRSANEEAGRQAQRKRSFLN